MKSFLSLNNFYLFYVEELLRISDENRND